MLRTAFLHVRNNVSVPVRRLPPGKAGFSAAGLSWAFVLGASWLPVGLVPGWARRLRRGSLRSLVGVCRARCALYKKPRNFVQWAAPIARGFARQNWFFVWKPPPRARGGADPEYPGLQTRHSGSPASRPMAGRRAGDPLPGGRRRKDT